MHAQHPQQTSGVSRRELLKAGLVAGMTLLYVGYPRFGPYSSPEMYALA